MAQSQPPISRTKLGGYDFYREVLGSPRYVVAPMVDQSELAWRLLSRRYGAQLVYTPMINAKLFVDPKNPKYRDLNFNIPNGEEGGPQDRPLIVQFCANDPDQLLQAAKIVEPHCDAVDINFGCPQDIARRGKYGCFLQDDWDLVYRLINILHTNLNIPVTAKFRVFPSVEKTVEYAQMMERAGAQILTCHGRTREQRGQNTGLADWDAIRAVKRAVNVPVFANGNVLYASDIPRCLAYTGADAVMSAEGQLYNAALFAPLMGGGTPLQTTTAIPPDDMKIAHPPHPMLALEYLSIVRSLKTRTPPSAVKGHLFKLMRPALARESDLRDRLGRVRGGGSDAKLFDEYAAICEEMRVRMERDMEAVQESQDVTGKSALPHWVAQPYFRPVPIQQDQDKGKRKASALTTDVKNAATAPDIAAAVIRSQSPTLEPEDKRARH